MRTPPLPSAPGRRRPGLLTLALSALAVAATLATSAVEPYPEPATASAATPATRDASRPSGADGGRTLDPARPRPAPTRPASSPAPAGATAAPSRVAPPARLSREGWLVAGGRSPVAGHDGPLVTYTVELAVGAGRGVILDGVAAEVTGMLSDLDHGWPATGAWRLQRVDDPAEARLRVLLAEPAVVDDLCAVAGLDTRGYFSCFNGSVAALNVDRWLEGVPHVPDHDLYRTYLVNHEVGHGLGYPHEPCPAPGALAPVMMQLTVSDEGCLPNGVPFP